jgi:BirA family biotin operon repressor/biotin-[acetyl-CoA-carboxylase] ligase
MCVVGVGLNVLPQELDGLGSGYACLAELAPALDAPQVLARVAPPLAQAVQRFERDGFASFADAFARRDLLRGHRIVTTGPDTTEGVAEGVDDRGGLRVRGDVLHTLSSGEVSVRLQDSAC